MAILIVEGCDFTGKSTLVNKLQKDLNLFSVKSPRPKSPQDVFSLVDKTNKMGEGMDIICDRICLISEPIYGPIVRDHIEPVLDIKHAQFMLESMQPIIIWCCPPWEHVRTCNNDQMSGVKEKLEELYLKYQDWFNGELMERFIVIPYDFTRETYESLKDDVEGYLDHRPQTVVADKEVADVNDFHVKFGVDTPIFPELMNPEAFAFRVKFMQEELDEFVEAHNEGDMVKAFDALLDLTYVAKGTACFMGIDAIQWGAGWDIVHNANMQKQRAQSASESKRGTALDVIKPPGWEVHKPEPHLKKLLGF